VELNAAIVYSNRYQLKSRTALSEKSKPESGCVCVKYLDRNEAILIVINALYSQGTKLSEIRRTLNETIRNKNKHDRLIELDGILNKTDIEKNIQQSNVNDQYKKRYMVDTPIYDAINQKTWVLLKASREDQRIERLIKLSKNRNILICPCSR
jgi:hypothetical protein